MTPWEDGKTGEGLGAYLAHAHVVAKGAVDDGGVVIDVEDVHSQSVLLPPGRHAAIRGLDLQLGRDLKKKKLFLSSQPQENSLDAQTRRSPRR